ncbi:hypothetical protein ACFL1S_00045 [Pseudomonadota bacterium]
MNITKAVTLLIMVFLLVIGSQSVRTLDRFSEAIIAPGPNTVGEAGKVYYANRAMVGETIFDNGSERPYYSSAHGALLHSSVGWLGKIVGAKKTGLYYIGRSLSVLATVFALVLAGSILRSMGIGVIWIGGLWVAFFAVWEVVYHAVSYRPDHWILLMSVSQCTLLMRRSNSLPVLFLLGVLPAVAFYIKAPGIWIIAPTILILLAEQRWKAVATTSSVFVVAIVSSITGLNMLSDGTFLAATRNTMGVGFSWSQTIHSLNVPALWPMLASPLLLFFGQAYNIGNHHKKLNVLMIFWSLSLLTSVVSSGRIGSDSYYFVEPYFFGLILITIWLERQWMVHDGHNLRRLGVALSVILVVGIFGIRNVIDHFRRPLIGIALAETLYFQNDRRKLAEHVNSLGLNCFSNDAGLNVLLDDPAILEPLVPSLMIRNGNLNMETMVGPVQRKEYDIIVFTGRRSVYRGVTHLPDHFFSALNNNYILSPEWSTRYQIYKRLP